MNEIQEFQKISKSKIVNIKEVTKQQTGTKNRIYIIVQYMGGETYRAIAGTLSGNKSLPELLELQKTKYTNYQIMEIVK